MLNRIRFIAFENTLDFIYHYECVFPFNLWDLDRAFGVEIVSHQFYEKSP